MKLTRQQSALRQARLYRVRILIALRAAEQSTGPMRHHVAHLRNTLRTLDNMVSHESNAHSLMPVHGEGIESTLRSMQRYQDRIAA